METGLRFVGQVGNLRTGWHPVQRPKAGACALLLALSALPLAATAPVPRESPDLTFLDASDNQVLLSSFKGKVVLIEFLLTNCPHCVRVAQTIEKLHRELGPRGFEAVGIAFENGISGQMVANFAQAIKVHYPLGYASSDQVDSYLGRVGMERFSVPQIVLIDQKGIIRAQSRPVGEIDLENEKYLHSMIDNLLREGGPSWISRVFSVSPVAILVFLGGVFVWRMNQKRQKS